MVSWAGGIGTEGPVTQKNGILAASEVGLVSPLGSYYRMHYPTVGAVPKVWSAELLVRPVYGAPEIS